ncbi:MAG: O-acetylhomoserine aminocarboxypropyltransferase/cysteine synthase family protein [Helicobacteraceae bacterium]
MKPETLAIHYGYEKDKELTMAAPLYQTTAYEFKSAQHGADLFALKAAGNIYTRLSNPTTDLFEKRFAAVEGGAAAVAFASGMSAIYNTVLNLCSAGDNIISSDKMYGGTINLFVHTLRRLNIVVRFFPHDQPQKIAELIDENTKAVFFESISNPSIDLIDFDEAVRIAKEAGVITVCDNTVATPFNFRPFDYGIDLSLHSTSKYVTGQGLALGGIVVERAGLNEFLRASGRYGQFNAPDESYHGFVWAASDAFCAFSLRLRTVFLRDLGATPAPFNSWLLIQGLETMGLRMQRHNENGLKIAEFLSSCAAVKSVKYPLLAGDTGYALAKKYLKGGSGLLSIELESYDAAEKFIEKLEIFSLVTNIGDTKSIVTHPASTTHKQLSSADLKACGVTPSLVRLSVGIENADDLIQDLKSALRG